MALSFSVWFKKEIKGFGQLGGDTVAIEPALRALDKLAKQCKVTPLSDLVSANPDEMAETLDLDAADLAKEEWFNVADGLKTVRALMAELRSTPTAVKNAEAVLEDLACLEEDLAKGAAAKVKFHFAIMD